MKNIKSYITESINNSIYEGFLDKLKRGIEDIIDNPKPYIEDFKKNLEKNKENKSIKYVFVKDQDAFKKALDEFNDDETLRKIYKWVTSVISKHNSIKDEQEKYTDYLYKGLIYTDATGIREELPKAIKAEFNIDSNEEHDKFLALVSIANAMAILYTKNNNKQKPIEYSEFSYSPRRKHNARNNARIAGIVAAAVAAR